MDKKPLNNEKHNLQMKVFELYQVLYQGRKYHFELLRARHEGREDLNESVSVVMCRRCCMNVDWKESKYFGVALIA